MIFQSKQITTVFIEGPVVPGQVRSRGRFHLELFFPCPLPQLYFTACHTFALFRKGLCLNCFFLRSTEAKRLCESFAVLAAAWATRELIPSNSTKLQPATFSDQFFPTQVASALNILQLEHPTWTRTTSPLWIAMWAKMSKAYHSARPSSCLPQHPATSAEIDGHSDWLHFPNVHLSQVASCGYGQFQQNPRLFPLGTTISPVWWRSATLKPCPISVARTFWRHFNAFHLPPWSPCQPLPAVTSSTTSSPETDVTSRDVAIFLATAVLQFLEMFVAQPKRASTVFIHIQYIYTLYIIYIIYMIHIHTYMPQPIWYITDFLGTRQTCHITREEFMAEETATNERLVQCKFLNFDKSSHEQICLQWPVAYFAATNLPLNQLTP